MKKMLLIIGIIIFVVCIVVLLFAALNLYGYHHVLDGSAELYNRLHRRANTYLMVGIVLAIIGTLCFIFQFKIK